MHDTDTDPFRCPNCNEVSIGRNNGIRGEVFGIPIYECDECGWQGEDPNDWTFYSETGKGK